jgi:hypothetical protein
LRLGETLSVGGKALTVVGKALTVVGKALSPAGKTLTAGGKALTGRDVRPMFEDVTKPVALADALAPDHPCPTAI